ncbi:DnaJ subfamily C member 1 [Chionoecetes opilio]|uniref:DnaJ subfamily C member 1 n=1 Tax=Chionoecetes opilio TaxID=41210 RepID=A0A8J5D1W4_CHIOP|nr:DnaJ subfamily C member 1 [Chionoecetes opilio]
MELSMGRGNQRKLLHSDGDFTASAVLGVSFGPLLHVLSHPPPPGRHAAGGEEAYRKLSCNSTPTKMTRTMPKSSSDRWLVSVYDVLRDEAQRARYNQVLVEGLPDWRSPIYYYRRARKMSLLEIAIILTVVISLTQYLMAWGTYIDTRQCVEEALVKKYKIKDRKKKKPEDIENILLMEEELSQIPRPSWWNILPVQLVRLTIFLVTGGPTLVREYLAYAGREEEGGTREGKKRRRRRGGYRKRRRRRRRRKRAGRREGSDVNLLPDFTNSECVLDSVDAPDEQRGPPPPPPLVSGGFWADEGFKLTKKMAK